MEGISEISQFAGLPIGAAALWIAWKIGMRVIRLSEKKLEQEAAREIAERNLRIEEAKLAREERAEERAERRGATEAITTLTTKMDQYLDVTEQLVNEVRTHIANGERRDSRGVGVKHGG